MVLCRQPKTYKRLMRIMASQLIEHESMMTTKAKVTICDIDRPNI